jgi:hypothetical protein
MAPRIHDLAVRVRWRAGGGSLAAIAGARVPDVVGRALHDGIFTSATTARMAHRRPYLDEPGLNDPSR